MSKMDLAPVGITGNQFRFLYSIFKMIRNSFLFLTNSSTKHFMSICYNSVDD